MLRDAIPVARVTGLLGDLHGEEVHPVEAAADLRAAIEASASPATVACSATAGSGRNTPDAEVHTKMALMLARLDRFPEARAELESALKIDPAFAPAQHLLADVRARIR